MAQQNRWVRSRASLAFATVLGLGAVVGGCSDTEGAAGAGAAVADTGAGGAGGGGDAKADGAGGGAGDGLAGDGASAGDAGAPADAGAPGDGAAGAPDGGAGIDGSTPADTQSPPGDTGPTGPGGTPDPTNACAGGCGTGSVTGVVCAPNEQVFVNGASVWVDATGCDGQPITVQVTSDSKGRYTLEGVPCGYQTVHIQKNSFEHEFKVPVAVGEETDVTAAGYKQCFKATAADIAVIEGDWDEIGGLLDQLGLEHDTYGLYGGWDGDWSGGQAINLLTNPSMLAQYDVIFINCGAAHDEIVSTNSAVAWNLRSWVEGGGSLYVSDFAFVYAEAAWPEAVDFMGDDSKGSMYESGGPIQMNGNQGVPGHVLDEALASYLGTFWIAVQYDIGPLVALSPDPQPASTTVHVDAWVEQFQQTLPLVVSFVPKPGAGRVVVTSFHNDAQATEQVMIVLNYLVFTL